MKRVPTDAYPDVPREVLRGLKGCPQMATRITPERYAAAGTEHAEQVAVFIWANDQILAGSRYADELRSMFAIANGGLRHKATAGRLKAEGVKSGVSDIFLPVPRWLPDGSTTFNGGVKYKAQHGLFIEMKPLKTGRATDEQEQFIALMKSRGYAATLCRGWIEATETIKAYLELPS